MHFLFFLLIVFIISLGYFLSHLFHICDNFLRYTPQTERIILYIPPDSENTEQLVRRALRDSCTLRCDLFLVMNNPTEEQEFTVSALLKTYTHVTVLPEEAVAENLTKVWHTDDLF